MNKKQTQKVQKWAIPGRSLGGYGRTERQVEKDLVINKNALGKG